MKKQITLLLLIVVALFSVGCSSKQVKPVDQLEAPVKGDTIATMHTTMGDIKIRLFGEQTPKTVENFVTHAKNGYYNNVSFHRVINDFMIQGGDPTATGAGGESIWGESFKDEFTNTLFHYRGALSMANAGANTNGSQFFIVQMNPNGQELKVTDVYTEKVVENYKNLGGTPQLDGRHAVFGQVYEGMDVVDAIAAVETDGKDKPVEDVLITSIDIEEVQ